MLYQLKTGILLFLFLISTAAHAGKYRVETYPEKIAKNCRNGIAKVYDQCGDQAEILGKARSRAAKTGKTVLVVYGAEWCIWCHVFDKYINGDSRQFDYRFEYEKELVQWQMLEKENKNAHTEAAQLNKYVAENFVVAHIEADFSPNGSQVVVNTGIDPQALQFLPFILVLDKKGKYAGHMPSSSAIRGLEVRKDSGEEYRGYDRKILLKQLQLLRKKVL